LLITSITEDVLDLPDAQRFALLGVDESAPAGGRVFAILDAGVLVNLVELAESRGAVGKCLFKGDLAEELQDQAPYLFALGAEDKFTEGSLTCY